MDVGRNRKIKPPIRSHGGLSDWKGKEYGLRSPPCFIREFILPPEGSPNFSSVCRNHSHASRLFQNCCSFEPAPTKQIGPNGEIFLGSRSSSFSPPPLSSSGCPSSFPSHRKLKFTLWHHSIKSVGFFPSVIFFLSFSPFSAEHTPPSDLKDLLYYG